MQLAAADAEEGRRGSADCQRERERMAARTAAARFRAGVPTEPNWRPRSCHKCARVWTDPSTRSRTNAHERVGRYASRRRRTDCRTPLASTPRARRSAGSCARHSPPAPALLQLHRVGGPRRAIHVCAYACLRACCVHWGCVAAGQWGEANGGVVDPDAPRRASRGTHSIKPSARAA